MKYVKENYNYYLFSFFLISVMFWILEMVYSLILRNKFVLPGVWYGPYCPIYGFTFSLLLVIFRKDKNIIINIIKIAITVILVEYIISFISSKIFNNVIWDYSGKFLNINGRICLEMSFIFTSVGIIYLNQ